MSLRAQPPARSPLGLGALVAGAGGWLAPDPAALAALAAELRASFGADDVLLTDSGTSALALAIGGALAGRPGSAVALPAWGCYDLATAAQGARAPVALYDLAPGTLGPDLASLERTLTREVAAIVVAHFHGVPADLDAVRRLADRHGALVIEDAAQAIGAALPAGPAGGQGPMSILSFGRGKGVSGGGGGALLARGAAAGLLAGARASLGPARRGTRELAGLAGQWLLGRPAVYGLPASLPFLALGQTIHHPPHPPRGMPPAAAAALGAAWPGALAEVAVRRRNAADLRAGHPLARTIEPPAGTAPSWLRLPVLLEPARSPAADEPRAHALGIYRGYPLALADLPGFGEQVVNRADGFPGARRLAAGLVTLPTHGLLTDPDRRRLLRWLDEG